MCTCVYVFVCACVWIDREGYEGEREDTASRVPKASTFCYAVARSWRRDPIKRRRTRHHGRPINPQTKVDYDFSRGHRSRLLLRSVHTHGRVHRFFSRDVYTATNLNIERSPPRVITFCASCPPRLLFVFILRLSFSFTISSLFFSLYIYIYISLFFFLSLFHLSASEISGEIFRRA